jgi:hypothetical protein
MGGLARVQMTPPVALAMHLDGEEKETDVQVGINECVE